MKYNLEKKCYGLHIFMSYIYKIFLVCSNNFNISLFMKDLLAAFGFRVRRGRGMVAGKAKGNVAKSCMKCRT